jgi:hypothetical protein
VNKGVESYRRDSTVLLSIAWTWIYCVKANYKQPASMSRG